ncbi:hypothetical protein KC316_g16 [Hortaea werneckii]|nr:hypothetical protein KC316_g16 [Hortaea werneckii]
MSRSRELQLAWTSRRDSHRDQSSPSPPPVTGAGEPERETKGLKAGTVRSLLPSSCGEELLVEDRDVLADSSVPLRRAWALSGARSELRRRIFGPGRGTDRSPWQVCRLSKHRDVHPPLSGPLCGPVAQICPEQKTVLPREKRQTLFDGNALPRLLRGLSLIVPPDSSSRVSLLPNEYDALESRRVKSSSRDGFWPRDEEGGECRLRGSEVCGLAPRPCFVVDIRLVGKLDLEAEPVTAVSRAARVMLVLACHFRSGHPVVEREAGCHCLVECNVLHGTSPNESLLVRRQMHFFQPHGLGLPLKAVFGEVRETDFALHRLTVEWELSLVVWTDFDSPDFFRTRCGFENGPSSSSLSEICRGESKLAERGMVMFAPSVFERELQMDTHLIR